MRLNFQNHRRTALATGLALAASAIAAVGTPGSASAAFPGSNGTLVASKCEDGGTCNIAHIWTVDPVSAAEHQLTTGAEYDDDPAVSPDGNRIAFERCPTGSTCRIAIVDASGSNQTDLTDGSGTGQDHPSFSPDGGLITFVQRDGTGQHIYVMTADGSNPAPLPGTGGTDKAPVFTSDGSSVLFTRYELGIGYRIFKAPINGATPPAAISSGPKDMDASISPDGSRIVFSRNWMIATMDASGANVHTLTSVPAGVSDEQPVFSPDGTQIVFEHLTDGVGGTSPLMAMNADGSNEHPITPTSEYLYKPDWQATHPAPAPAAAPAPAPSGACSHKLAGTRRADTLEGTIGGDLLSGLGGADRIAGRAGDDCLSGGKGNDRLAGGAGADRLSGGPGSDTLAGGAGRDVVRGGSGSDVLNLVDGTRDSANCGRGTDTVRADAVDRLRGCEHVIRVKR